MAAFEVFSAVLTDVFTVLAVPFCAVFTVFLPAERADCLTVFEVCSTVRILFLPPLNALEDVVLADFSADFLATFLDDF